MAAALGHPVTFSSKVGRGTIFHIDVPVGIGATADAIASRADMERPRGYGLFGTKVLLVENDAEVLQAMTFLLERWQCLVRAATSTDDALDMLGDTDWVPDIVIADQHLDGGDLGTATIAEVRDYLGRAVPALIVTADSSEAVAKAARAGRHRTDAQAAEAGATARAAGASAGLSPYPPDGEGRRAAPGWGAGNRTASRTRDDHSGTPEMPSAST